MGGGGVDAIEVEAFNEVEDAIEVEDFNEVVDSRHHSVLNGLEII